MSIEASDDSSSDRPGYPWQGHAFGLAVRSQFEFAGWAIEPDQPELRSVVIELAPRAELRALAYQEPSEVLLQHRGPRGDLKLRVRILPCSDYLMEAPELALYQLSADGGVIRCAPTAGVSPWRWQRSVIGQALPFACYLRGLEPFHASAVELDGVAVVLIGQSGYGKSTLAAELVLGGGTLLTDDVLAVEAASPDAAVGHPGPGLMNLRRVTVDRLGPVALQRLGTRVGSSTEGVRLAVPRHEAAVPIRVIYQLQGAEAGTPIRLDEAASVVPPVLGGTFVGIARTSERLARQLDVLSAIAACARVVVVTIPAGADLRHVSELVLADARRTR